MTATLTKWYEEHGRHEIFAGGKKVALENADHSLTLNQEHVHAGATTTLDDQGIARTAREEKLRARDAKVKQDAENARMMAFTSSMFSAKKLPRWEHLFRSAAWPQNRCPSPPQSAPRKQQKKSWAIRSSRHRSASLVPHICPQLADVG